MTNAIQWIYRCGSGWSYCKDGFCGRYNQIKEDGGHSAKDMSEEWKEKTGEDWEPKSITMQYIRFTTTKCGSPPWTGQFESYTPIEYIKSVKAVMGDIDLDPASNAKRQTKKLALIGFSI